METNHHIKTYTNGEITVVWDNRKCVHAGNCVRNLPQVFKPMERPWVKIHSASSEEIIATVQTCPNGALSILGS